jgi:phospholipase/carboxylesterase
MHGLGSNEKDLFGLAAQVPDSFLVISLRAPYSYTQDGYAWYSVEFKGNQIIGNVARNAKEQSKNL